MRAVRRPVLPWRRLGVRAVCRPALPWRRLGVRAVHRPALPSLFHSYFFFRGSSRSLPAPRRTCQSKVRVFFLPASPSPPSADSPLFFPSLPSLQFISFIFSGHSTLLLNFLAALTKRMKKMRTATSASKSAFSPRSQTSIQSPSCLNSSRQSSRTSGPLRESKMKFYWKLRQLR